jgi:ABC-2 type transport system permease protein
MTLLAHEIRFDLLTVWRNPRARIMTLAFPLLLLVILVGISKGGTTTVGGAGVSLQRFFVGGIMAMSVLTACYAALVSTVVSRRETGVYKRRRATPVPAWVVVAGQALTTTLVGLTTAAVLLIAARVIYGIGMPAKGIAIAAVVSVAGALALSAVGFAVSTLVPNVDAAQPAVQLTMLPLYFISGIWFSTDDLPEGLQKVAQLLPVEPLAHGLHVAFLSGTLDGGDVVTLAVWAVLATLFAARRFSWLPRPA